MVGVLDREGIPRKRGLEEWRRRDGIDGTKHLGSRVGLIYVKWGFG